MTSRPTPAETVLLWILAMVAGVAVVLTLGTGTARAQELDPEGSGPRWNSEACLNCHDGSTEVVIFPSGQQLGVAVDGEAFRSSHHADVGVQCVHCHTNITKTPHSEVTLPDVEAFEASLATTCSQCHWREYTVKLDQVHALVNLDVRDDTPGCIDCHDPHGATAFALDDPQMKAKCTECHASAPTGELTVIHALNPIQTEEASAPSLIWFYVLMVAALAALIGVAWAGVAAIQWARRRMATAH